MRKLKAKTFKKGAASFYVVAFSTLILVIIAASFAAIIISEIERTSNDDLAQSAYDSALAGVEDAKLAYYNYQNCLAQGATKAASINDDGILTCGEIIYLIENGGGENENCDMVAQILNREVSILNEKGDKGIIVRESDTDNKMLQAYTCVKIQTKLDDYRSTISNTNPSKIVRVKLDDGVSSKDIKTVEISWYNDKGSMALRYNNFNKNDNKVVFNSVASGVSVPPTISVTLIQTSGQFNLSDFEMSRGSQTNRATAFLVPTDSANGASSSTSNNNYVGVYRARGSGRKNFVTKDELLKSNDKTVMNKPFAVYCDPNSDDEFICSATLELPEPVGGDRNDDTFLFVVSYPYGKPTADFAMRFCINENGCSERKVVSGETIYEDYSVDLKDSQISIDSTGRANDLFRRVEMVFDIGDTGFPYPLYAIQLLGKDKDDSLLKKDLKVICEWNFPNRGC